MGRTASTRLRRGIASGNSFGGRSIPLITSAKKPDRCDCNGCQSSFYNDADELTS